VTLSPGANISTSLASASPGTVVCLNNGNYSQNVTFGTSGTAGAWIKLTAVNPQGATVNSININGESYIEVDNLVVTGGNDSGIYTSYGNHTRIIGNTIANMPGGGINLNLGDYRYVAYNTVYGCSAGTSDSTSGISIWEPEASDTAAGYHNYIGYNVSYNNHDPVGGTDGNGIVFDDANGTQQSGVVYYGGVLIEENLTYGNGGAGIKVYESQNALIRNNSTYENQAFTSNSQTWRAEIANEYSSNNVFVNNIFFANSALNPYNAAVCECDSTSDTWDNNITYDANLGSGNSSINGSISGTGNLLGVNPLYMNPPSNLELQSGSPAIGAGTNAFGLPAQDFSGLGWNTIEIGAYAFDGTTESSMSIQPSMTLASDAGRLPPIVLSDAPVLATERHASTVTRRTARLASIVLNYVMGKRWN
jgi:hypothetical protein